MKRSPQLDRYKQLVGEDLLACIYRAASPLAGVHVLHLNTTAEGGGVAELLHSPLPLMEELGIPIPEKSSRWMRVLTCLQRIW